MSTAMEPSILQDPSKVFVAFLFIVLVILLGLALPLSYWSIRKRREAREKRYSEFTSKLVRAFLNGAAAGFDDVLSFYHAHFETSRSGVQTYRDIYERLETVQLQISSSEKGQEAYKLIERLPAIRELMKSAAEKLNAAEKRAPFFGTPAPERKLLEDILELTSGDREIVNGKLIQLGELIRARQETVNTLGEEKGRAKQLSYWGLVGTIIFGLASLALTAWSITR
jgi:hypothetical protein